jgi:excisionase family DNA binding protein
MTTQEVAEYLRIKERKVYDLVQRGAIPCSRVTGKWLFRKTLIDQWLDEHSYGGEELESRGERPPVIGGSHDPLLEWAVRDSHCGLATLFDGSGDGLERFARGTLTVTGLHLLDNASGEYNLAAASAALPGVPFVLIEWAWREQGLMLAAGNPLAIAGLGDLTSGTARVMDRQPGAGSHQLLRALLTKGGHSSAALQWLPEPARNEHEVALAVLNGQADAGFGVGCAARQFGLHFVPLQRERYDLLVSRHDYFEPPLQRLLAFTRDPRFPAKAAALGSYDLGGTGTVHYNAP